MEERDLIKELDELLNPTDPPKEAALENTAETPSPISLQSILPRLPRKGRLGSMASITIAEGQSSMICAPTVQTYS